MKNRGAARERTQMLKRLRATHQETVSRTQANLKEQKAIRRQICTVLREGPRTIPEVAEAAGLPAEQVLWHISAMKKYDLAREVSQCGEYFSYEIVKDGKK